MAGNIDRAFAVLELLATAPEGLPLHAVGDRLDLPRSAAHRLLKDLIRLGFVRQDEEQGDYRLTTRLMALGFIFLARTGITDVAQPILDELARDTGELVRLGVVDNGRLTWIAKAQGARSGLRYDPDMGQDAVLFCTASGHAWLSTLTDERALAMIAAEGFGRGQTFGPNAPRTVQAFLDCLAATRARGYGMVTEASAPGTAAIAAPVRHPVTGATIAVLAIAGPHFRLPPERMESLAPTLLSAAGELAALGAVSPFLTARPLPPADA